ncbi:RHO family class C beta-lactamase [Cereibacter sphaeroides]|uniref:RHO family class C beta-lactamase n=1 Tax=Cereibacter sphaeroides TaxID=1063 RepID=UPI000F529090|nr:RHO family class C beta-lactamase [Cereibacter sphaeroides]AZB65438.1 RHO family class C beta-lactamase [Cereibacter sphaeroides]AZB70183.1 RHO family class C beta-lactamase [Cereibacter sphaeroides]
MKHLPPLSILLMAGALTPALAQDSTPAFESAAAAAFESVIEEHDIPGLVVGVTHGGRHSFYQTGLASREDQQPVTPDTLFELGSISKIFNVTLAALAEERGALSLDAPVADYLPSLRGSPAGELTLIDLATHHTGGLPLQVPDDVADVDRLVDWLRSWRPPEPGARSYSNISIGLLGHITAGVMGMSYADASQTALFPALGLKSTWIDVPTEAMGRYAFGYDRKTNAPIRVTPGVLNDEAYGVKSSARDMLTLLDLELGIGPASPEVQRAVATTQEGRFRTRLYTQAMIWEAYPWPVDQERLVEGNGYDFILQPQPMDEVDATPDQRVILNKTGSTNGFGGYIAMVPSENLGVVVLANRNYPNEARVRATHDLITHILAE